MRPYDIIRMKRDGGALSPEAIRTFIHGYVSGAMEDYHAAALLMAVYLRGMGTEELAAWTREMIATGETLAFTGAGPYVDKHSTGGVGDKISLPLAPLAASLGCRVPMLSGRALGHTGGTLDKLEAIPGFRVDLPADRFREIVETTGCCIMGQTERLVPADRRLYALRDVTATVASIPLIASSILSKKRAAGVQGLVMDVKTGSGAFMKTRTDSHALARTLVDLGTALGMRVHAFVTDMGQPLGQWVGNALELRETVEILRGEGPPDTTALTRRFAEALLLLGGLAASPVDAAARVDAALQDGRGLGKLREMVVAQGGDPAFVDDPEVLGAARLVEPWSAPRPGFVVSVDTETVGAAACLLGAGRVGIHDRVDPAVGFEVLRRVGDPVRAGEPLLAIHANDPARLAACRERLEGAYVIGGEPPQETPLVLEELS
ncbi:MAG: thymidine phosphorylase [Deltaproteobacteria bacterium]|nr:thymidine phosphorylase [Deltaproteobacteria bacterium]